MRPVFKTFIKVAILLGVLAYFIFALTTINRPDEEQVCKGLDIVVDDQQQTGFIGENEIRELLVKKKLFPEGKALKDVDLAQLESVLVASPYIEQALCFTTAEGNAPCAYHARPQCCWRGFLYRRPWRNDASRASCHRSHRHDGEC